MSLTEIQAKQAKPKDKPYKLAAGHGLYLLVNPNGSKIWGMKYRIGGKEWLLSFGKYPAISISAARQKQVNAKAALVRIHEAKARVGLSTSTIHRWVAVSQFPKSVKLGRELIKSTGGGFGIS